MGLGMTCATYKFCGGAVVAQVAQKAGLRHCATTLPPKGGIGWGGASGAMSLRWRRGGGMTHPSPTTRTGQPSAPMMALRHERRGSGGFVVGPQSMSAQAGAMTPVTPPPACAQQKRMRQRR